jgi:hypothetical protein
MSLTFIHVPDSPTPEYVWRLGRFTGHVWRNGKNGRNWAATIHGVKVCGAGRTRRDAILDATMRGYNR